MTILWLVQKVTSDEKRVGQTLMGSATFPSEQVGEDELVAGAESDGDGAAGGAVELVVIFASCLSVILRVLYSVYQTSFLSVIFTSFILGFIQGVVSLLFGQFYSVCYFTSFWSRIWRVYSREDRGPRTDRRDGDGMNKNLETCMYTENVEKLTKIIGRLQSNGPNRNTLKTYK
jgi:hypothetical protein